MNSLTEQPKQYKVGIGPETRRKLEAVADYKRWNHKVTIDEALTRLIEGEQIPVPTKATRKMGRAMGEGQPAA